MEEVVRVELLLELHVIWVLERIAIWILYQRFIHWTIATRQEHVRTSGGDRLIDMVGKVLFRPNVFLAASREKTAVRI